MLKKVAQFARLPLLLIVFVALALPEIAQASSLLCRSDPVVILSNGMTLDMGATISTLPMQVTEVHYELHVPAGVTAVIVIRTPAWLTSQETFTVYDDQQPEQYQTVTTVHTSLGDAAVMADTSLVSLLNIHLGYYAVSGKEGDRLALSFSN